MFANRATVLVGEAIPPESLDQGELRNRIEDAEGRSVTVRSKFTMVEYRRETQRLFAGTATHRLVQTDGGIRIAWKRVDLVNCDAPMDGITVPF